MILKKAVVSDLNFIWNIIQQAIEQRKQDGSEQWQNGYPNEQTIGEDLKNGCAYVLVHNNIIIAYSAIIFGIEPAYNEINGSWLTKNNDYLVVHRVATLNSEKGKGVATHLFRLIENMCIEQKVNSIRVDTNFDNVPMLKILDKLGYTYCGEIFISDKSRRAYEKIMIVA